MADFRKGDIVQNLFAGKTNPNRFLLYIGKGTCSTKRQIGGQEQWANLD